MFLGSIARNSILTAHGYKTALVYLQDFLSKHHDYRKYTIENILPLIANRIDIYKLLDEFITFMDKKKKVNAASIIQYVNGIRSYLAYHDVYIIPNKFKHKVKVPKILKEEEQALDAKDIRQILLNCHNRRLKAYLLVLASGGLRATEACAIRLCDVDYSSSPTKIHVRKEYAKTRVARDIYISDEATKYLKDWINYKYSADKISDSNTSGDENYNVRRKKSDTLVFQVQLNNSNVTPRSIYFKLITQFQQLLTVAGFDERKEGMRRRKITLHSCRRFAKTIISDCAGKEYSEWFLGHAKSVYYVSKPIIRAATYAEKCMKWLTFLDYGLLEATGKSIESKLSEKEQEIQLLRQRDKLKDKEMQALNQRLAEVEKVMHTIGEKLEVKVIRASSHS